jgi:hypothetical protein
MCSNSHVEIVPREPASAGMRFAQVRANQRAAFYRMPDGSISIPPTNSFNDEVAVAAVRQGGVRDEGYHIGDLRRLQREQRQSDDDEFNDRSLVLDYDHSTLSGDFESTFLRNGLRNEDAARQRVLKLLDEGRIRLSFGGE